MAFIVTEKEVKICATADLEKRGNDFANPPHLPRHTLPHHCAMIKCSRTPSPADDPFVLAPIAIIHSQ